MSERCIAVIFAEREMEAFLNGDSGVVNTRPCPAMVFSDAGHLFRDQDKMASHTRKHFH